MARVRQMRQDGRSDVRHGHGLGREPATLFELQRDQTARISRPVVPDWKGVVSVGLSTGRAESTPLELAQGE